VGKVFPSVYILVLTGKYSDPPSSGFQADYRSQ
jgi:hypothetical protein